jgi:hypothetical protein
MDRVFLDANVLFVASYREQAALLRLWQLPNTRLLASTYVLREAFDNVPEAAQAVRLAELVTKIELVAEKPQDELAARNVGLPQKDVPILHAAISGNATHLVTADVKHFGRFFGATIEGVRILPPHVYLRQRSARSTISTLKNFLNWLIRRS